MNVEPLPRIGPRIVLRRFVRSDLDAFQTYRHDARVARYQGWIAQPDEQALALLERMANAPLFAASQWVQIGIAERDGNLLIGDIGICVHADQRSAEIGFSLRTPSQGLGLASEAVRETCAMLLELTTIATIIAHADARNVASIRLLERLGMRHVDSATSVSHGEARCQLGFRLERAAAARALRALPDASASPRVG